MSEISRTLANHASLVAPLLLPGKARRTLIVATTTHSCDYGA